MDELKENLAVHENAQLREQIAVLKDTIERQNFELGKKEEAIDFLLDEQRRLVWQIQKDAEEKVKELLRP